MNLRQNKQTLNKLVEASKARTLTPMEKTQYRLFNACVQGFNQALGICNNLINKVVNGASGLMNFSIGAEVVFTEPKTDNFWQQSQHLDELIPASQEDNIPSHLNIKKILSLPSEERIKRHRNPLYDYLNGNEIAERMNGSVIKRNSNHPLHSVFTTLVALRNHKYNAENFYDAGKDVLNVLNGNPSKYGADNFIKNSLKHIAPVIILLGCEPNRLKIADQIKGIDLLDKLWVVAKTALIDILQYGLVLNKQQPYIETDTIYINDISFDQLTSNDLKTLLVLYQFTGNITAALSFFDTSSPQSLPLYFPATTLPRVNEDGELLDRICYEKYIFTPSVPHALSYIHDQIFQACSAATAKMLMDKFLEVNTITFEGDNDLLTKCANMRATESSLSDNSFRSIDATTFWIFISACIFYLAIAKILERSNQLPGIQSVKDNLFWKPVNKVNNCFRFSGYQKIKTDEDVNSKQSTLVI